MKKIFIDIAGDLRISLIIFLCLYALVTFSIWKKYEWNKTSMIHFGDEFAKLNSQKMPDGAIVERSVEGDLGAGYDGQIFYFYSRTISELSTSWPKGFDESYRAPRIGYPALIGIFGFLGKNSAVYGMYILNLGLFILSFLALREMLGENKYLSFFYLISPFSLGSYSVLVSDSVMSSLTILSFYFFKKEKHVLFLVFAWFAILTKEPSLFLFFPLGLVCLMEKNWKKAFLVAATILVPVLWHGYLRITFPNWSATRLADFITPIEGIRTYITTLSISGGMKEIARTFSRFPLLLLLALGIYAISSSNIKKGILFKIGIILNFLMICTASYYHFWSVYENISRMFTVSIPLMIYLANEEEKALPYLYFSVIILFLFLVKVVFIQKSQGFFIWGM